MNNDVPNKKETHDPIFATVSDPGSPLTRMQLEMQVPVFRTEFPQNTEHSHVTLRHSKQLHDSRA